MKISIIICKFAKLRMERFVKQYRLLVFKVPYRSSKGQSFVDQPLLDRCFIQRYPAQPSVLCLSSAHRLRHHRRLLHQLLHPTDEPCRNLVEHLVSIPLSGCIRCYRAARLYVAVTIKIPKPIAAPMFPRHHHCMIQKIMMQTELIQFLRKISDFSYQELFITLAKI